MKNRSFLLVNGIVLCAFLGFFACDKIRKDKGIIRVEVKMDPCFQPHNATDEWVIQTQAEFDSLLATTTCSSLPATDFNTYTLLGKYTAGGCKSKFFRQVLRDDGQKKAQYNILVKSRGFCKKETYSYNWVLVDKLPEDYSVEFYVKKK